MANDPSIATAAAINDAAAFWLLRLEAAASPELQMDFQKWLEAEPRHRAAFIRLRLAWSTSEQFRLFRPVDGRVDEDLLTKLEVPQ